MQNFSTPFPGELIAQIDLLVLNLDEYNDDQVTYFSYVVSNLLDCLIAESARRAQAVQS